MHFSIYQQNVTAQLSVRTVVVFFDLCDMGCSDAGYRCVSASCAVHRMLRRCLCFQSTLTQMLRACRVPSTSNYGFPDVFLTSCFEGG